MTPMGSGMENPLATNIEPLTGFVWFISRLRRSRMFVGKDDFFPTP